MLRMSGWVAVPAGPDRAKDAGILIVGHRAAMRQRQAGTRGCGGRAGRCWPRCCPAASCGNVRLLVSRGLLLRWQARLVRWPWVQPRWAPRRPRTGLAVRALVGERARQIPGRGRPAQPRRTDRPGAHARCRGGACPPGCGHRPAPRAGRAGLSGVPGAPVGDDHRGGGLVPCRYRPAAPPVRAVRHRAPHPPAAARKVFGITGLMKT